MMFRALSLFLMIGLVWASPVDRMNKAFESLMNLLPYMTDKDKFIEKKNESEIIKRIEALEKNFKGIKHDSLLKQDVFSPSLDLVQDNLRDSKEAFKQGHKDYAWWRISELTTQCLSCHTRLPPAHASSFANRGIDQNKFTNPYDLGIAQLIVRKYDEAKKSFRQAINERIEAKDFTNILLPLKQLLLIQTKVLKEPTEMISILKEYRPKLALNKAEEEILSSWYDRLATWSKGKPWPKDSITGEAELKEFINKVMKPLFKEDSIYVGKFDVDLLMASGLLSNFLLESPETKLAPQAVFWLGMVEKTLRRESFFGTGELMLRNCVLKYPQHPIAKACYRQYKESVEFGFTGSRGKDIPPAMQSELRALKKLLPK